MASELLDHDPHRYKAKNSTRGRRAIRRAPEADTPFGAVQRRFRRLADDWRETLLAPLLASPLCLHDCPPGRVDGCRSEAAGHAVSHVGPYVMDSGALGKRQGAWHDHVRHGPPGSHVEATVEPLAARSNSGSRNREITSMTSDNVRPLSVSLDRAKNAFH